MMLSAGKMGLKYALALSGATFAYATLDESIGYARESYLGIIKPEKEVRGIEDLWGRYSWRQGQVYWEDGAIAGGLLGIGVTIACE
jgi:hypothetical protein